MKLFPVVLISILCADLFLFLPVGAMAVSSGMTNVKTHAPKNSSQSVCSHRTLTKSQKKRCQAILKAQEKSILKQKSITSSPPAKTESATNNGSGNPSADSFQSMMKLWTEHGGNAHDLSNGDRKNGGEVNYLPSCQGNSQLTNPSIDIGAIASIIPLGNLNPWAGHVTPTDHMYFNVVGGSPPVGGMPNSSATATLYAPGDATLTRVQSSEHTLNGATFKDYRLTFSPCRELMFYFDHVQTISSAIQTAVDKAGQPQACGNDQQSGRGQKMCQYMVSLQLKSGEKIGTVGSVSDFGGSDLRTTTLGFINQVNTISGPMQYFHSICPIDYFSPDSLKTALYHKIKNTRVNAEGLPDCGTTMQDKVGTLQGNWYLTGAKFQNGIMPFDSILSFVHSNTNPDRGTISIGGTIAPPGEISFAPISSGIVNREPSQVTPDGIIYCYEDDRGGHYHILATLTDATTLKVESQQGSCGYKNTFVNPTVYVR